MDFYTETNEAFDFYSFTFDANAFLSLTKKEQRTLSDTCIGLMLFLSAFAIASNAGKINIYGMVDQLQLRTTSTCGGFALQFLQDIYHNTSLRICSVKICTVDTIRDIITHRFTRGNTRITRIKNEYNIQEFINTNGIRGEFQ